MIRPFRVSGYKPNTLYSGDGGLSVPGGVGSADGDPDGSGVDSESGNRSGVPEDSGTAAGLRTGREDSEESVMPADFRTLPVHSTVVSRNAQTSRSVIRRKRERICFIRSPRQHSQMGIFGQIRIVAAGYTAKQSGKE